MQSNSPPQMTRHLVERTTVAVFACVVALIVLLSAYFTANRPTYMDELGLYNPAYMVAHYGKLTYPIYGDYEKMPVIVHPPIHVGLIGLLSRLGLTWYYAEGTPTAFLLLLGVWIVARGAFPTPVKLGLLFGVGFLMSAGNLPVAWFGTRPEGALHAAWFTALLLLESGRLDNWNRGRLFGGAFLLTWASSIHYYATPVVFGLTVYLAWAVFSLGWKEARPRVLALAGGALLFALPYVALYIAPNWHSITAAIRGQTGGSSIGQHMDLYRQWARASGFPLVLRKALGLGVPLMVFSSALLAAVRSTRGMAIASLPLQLGIFFFAAHKQPSYLVHELTFFVASLSVGVLTVVYWLAGRPQLPAWSRGAAMSLAAAVSSLYLVTGFASAGTTVISARAQIHPGDLARAATKQILGPHARVVGRMGCWYSGGGEIWHDHFHDLISAESSSYDPVHYLENFDAAVDYRHFSGNDSDNTEHKTLSYWYATGLLKLRGFYFAQQAGDLRLVLMSVKRPRKVVGYAAIKGALYRFDESPSGDHEVITATCPTLPEMEGGRFDELYPWASAAVLELPKSNPRPPTEIVTILSPRAAPEPAGLLRRSCVEVGRVRGLLSPADADALVAALRREDTPIRFYSDIEDMPGFQGVGVPADALPPAGAVPLEGVVNLSELDLEDRASRIERVPVIRVTTPAAPGTFAVYAPLHAAGKIAFPFWIQLRIRVLSGRVGLAATTRTGGILARTGPFLPSPEPVEVALKLPDPVPADDIVVFNWKPGGSQVEILDATAVASRQDGLAYRRLIETSGSSKLLGVPADLVPPAGALRLDSIVKLAEAAPGYKTARIERLPRIRVTTPNLPGAFGASFPLHLVDRITTPVWVQVRLKVLSGRIGLAVYNNKSGIVVRSDRWLLATAEPIDAALQVPDLSRGDTFVVFNGSVGTASQFEILDIGVMVPRKDAPRYARLFPEQASGWRQ